MNPAQLTGESLDIYRVLRAAIEGKNAYNARRAIEAAEWSLANECVVKEGSAKHTAAVASDESMHAYIAAAGSCAMKGSV